MTTLTFTVAQEKVNTRSFTFAAGDPPVKSGHRLRWPMSLIHAEHRLGWASLVGASQRARWGAHVGAEHRSAWAIPVWADRRLRWGVYSEASHRFTWSVPTAPAEHRSAWADAPADADFIGAQAERRFAWSDAIAAQATHADAWADAPADAAFSGAQAEHHALWSDAIAARATHAATWADAPADAGFVGAQAEHRGLWADASPTQAAHQAAWGDTPPGQVLTGTQAAHRLAWRLRAEGAGAHRSRWDLLARHQAGAEHAQRWDMLSGFNLVSVDATPQITWQGETARVESAELSADEGSPIWMAERIALSDQSLWQRIQIGDTIALAIGAETWTLRVDGKGYSADHPNRQYSLSAVSPLAWLGDPYAATADVANLEHPVSARSLIASLLAPVGAVEWQIEDWQIPRGTLALTNATPLQAARSIAAAVGAVVESAPDGTSIVRARHPISVPDYASADPDHRFEQSQIFGASVTAAPYVGMNRVVISNEQLIGANASDRIEYVRDEGNDYSGTVRAWPRPHRAVELAHTGHPETIIDALGERDATIEVLVEFIGGEASVQYPIHALDAVEWQHTDLGAVEPSGLSGLRAAVAGNALAMVTYRTRSIDWRVALDQDEHVQFVLI